MKDFSKAFHTPLEAMRTVYDRDFERYATQIDRGTNYILVMSTTEQDSKDRAELIVTAVNNFNDLSKFLRMVNDCLNDGIPIEKNDPVHNVAKQLLESLK